MTEKISRRAIVTGFLATVTAGCSGGIPDLRNLDSGGPTSRGDFASAQDLGQAPVVDPQHIAIRRMPYHGAHAPGTMIVNFEGFKLYHITYDGMATEYPIALGRQGVNADYNGLYVAYKDDDPTWTPTPSMRARNPSLPESVRGGHPNNPLGSHAVYFYNRDGSDSYLRAHGTRAADRITIGTNASSGCFRMLNEHAEHLYTFVRIPEGATNSPIGKSSLVPHRDGMYVPGVRYDRAHVLSPTDVALATLEEARIASLGPRPT